MSEQKPLLTVTLNPAVDVTLTVAEVELGQSYTALEVLKLPGGKGLNVARTLLRCGVPVVATGLLGGAPTPFITAALRDEGIIPAFLSIAGETRTCTAIVERDRHRATEVNEPGPLITAQEEAAFEEHISRLLTAAAAVAFSGSLPRGLPDDYYARLLRRAHAAGLPTVLDTSGRALGPALATRPLLVKPNAREAATLLGAPVDGVTAGRQAGEAIRERGAQMVALSLGADGVVLVTASGAWWARGPLLDPLSTVGSGDAFIGGFLASLHAAAERGAAATLAAAAGESALLIEALGDGCACAAANTQRLGGGVFDTAAVEAYRPRVSVTPL